MSIPKDELDRLETILKECPSSQLLYVFPDKLLGLIAHIRELETRSEHLADEVQIAAQFLCPATLELAIEHIELALAEYRGEK